MTKNSDRTSYKKRLQITEDLMLSGYGAKQIHEKLSKDFKVAYGTIRNDIVKINKIHGERLDRATQLHSKQQLLARSHLLRRLALEDGRDLKLVHTINKDIAGLGGVTLSINDRTVTLNLEKARGYLDLIFNVVFSHVLDDKTRKLILDEVNLIEQDLE